MIHFSNYGMLRTSLLAIILLMSSALQGQAPQPQTKTTRPDAPSSPPSNAEKKLTIDSLLAMEQQVNQVLPKVLPCVVSFDGGSGVIVSSNGHILTASHVSQRAGRKVKIHLSDGRTVMATTLGSNHRNDTGALQIDTPGPWPFVKLAESNHVQPGDWCLAFGYPMAFPRGKPAAVRLGRILKIDDLTLVTDCPIMGGDSGGPLLNLQGELIGITSHIKNDIRKNVHVPIDIFKDNWKELMASTDIASDPQSAHEKAYLGIRGETDQARVRVRQVYSGSPAETAGLLAEDVIVQIDGIPVESFDEVLHILRKHHPGEEIIAELNRHGNLLKLPIRLGETN